MLSPWLRAGQQTLVQETVPRHLVTVEIAGQITRLEARAERLSLATTPEQATDSMAAIRGGLARIRQNLTDGTRFAAPWQRDLIAQQIGNLDAAFARLGEASLARTEGLMRQQTLMSRLSLLNMQDLGWLEARLTQTVARVEGWIGSDQLSTSAQVTGQLRVLGTLSQLRNIAHRANEQVRWASQVTDAREQMWIRADLAKSFEQAEGLIDRLPEAERAGVADSFRSLEDLATGTEGLLAERDAHRRRLAEMATHGDAVKLAFTRIGGFLDQFARETEAGMVTVPPETARVFLLTQYFPAGIAGLGLLIAGIGLRSLRVAPDMAPQKVAQFDIAKEDSCAKDEVPVPQPVEGSEVDPTSDSKSMPEPAPEPAPPLGKAASPPKAVPKVIDLETLAQSIFTRVAGERAFSLRFTGDPTAMDPATPGLAQVLTILMSNALTHHDREVGEVLLAVDRSGGQLRMRLVDDGPGISRTDQDDLLKPGDSEATMTGLGLVGAVMEELGGSIDIVSDPAKFRGAAFILLWPNAAEKPTPAVLTDAA